MSVEPRQSACSKTDGNATVLTSSENSLSMVMCKPDWWDNPGKTATLLLQLGKFVWNAKQLRGVRESNLTIQSSHSPIILNIFNLIMCTYVGGGYLPIHAGAQHSGERVVGFSRAGIRDSYEVGPCGCWVGLRPSVRAMPTLSHWTISAALRLAILNTLVLNFLFPKE